MSDDELYFVEPDPAAWAAFAEQMAKVEEAYWRWLEANILPPISEAKGSSADALGALYGIRR